MRRTLFESFTRGPLTEAAPKPDEAGARRARAKR